MGGVGAEGHDVQQGIVILIGDESRLLLLLTTGLAGPVLIGVIIETWVGGGTSRVVN